ncbi:MAG: tetratricopeptide repeat protein [Vicinamibacterales bacterium]
MGRRSGEPHRDVGRGHRTSLAIAIALWLGVAALDAYAQTPRDRPIDETLTAVRTLIDAGKTREAIATLEALGRSDEPRIAHLLGVAAYHGDDYTRAISVLSPLEGRFPEGSIERHEIVQVLGLSLFLSGRLEEAIPKLEATRAWASSNLELAHILGQAYLQTGRTAAARQAFARTFNVAEDSAAAHLVTAQVMIRLQLEGPAEEELKRAITKEPNLPQANLLLGQLALFRGQFDDSIALTRRELTVAPGNALAYYQLGDAYIRQSRWDDGIAALQQSLWLNPFYSGPYILLGKAYSHKGQPATAEGMLRRAVEYDPNNRTAHYLLAQLLQQAGRADEAKQEFAIAERLQGQPGR